MDNSLDAKTILRMQSDYDREQRAAGHSTIVKVIVVVALCILLPVLWFKGVAWYKARQWKAMTFVGTAKGHTFSMPRRYKPDIVMHIRNWRMVRRESDANRWVFKYYFTAELEPPQGAVVGRCQYWIDFADQSGVVFQTETGTFSMGPSFRRDVSNTIEFYMFPQNGEHLREFTLECSWQDTT